ncbi:MAG: hypothetical protein NTY38_22275, partial [Acidobacteria bacterium]|nr:hypothetical protein [Acidobacteriota bacterium]
SGEGPGQHLIDRYINPPNRFLSPFVVGHDDSHPPSLTSSPAIDNNRNVPTTTNVRMWRNWQTR